MREVNNQQSLLDPDMILYDFHQFPYEGDHSCSVYNITSLGQADKLMMSGT